MKHKPEEPNNPFDDPLFWLQLACMDFTFGLEETTNRKLDASASEIQPPEMTDFNPKPADSKEHFHRNCHQAKGKDF